MINGQCVSFNKDAEFYRSNWPTKFVAVPRPGDFVRSNKDEIMQVVQVIHTLEEVDDGHYNIEYIPQIEIVLTGVGCNQCGGDPCYCSKVQELDEYNDDGLY
jgi:hypothetical protein